MISFIMDILSNICGYVGFIKNQSFLQPLSKEEEAYYLSKLSENDQEARGKLIEHNLRLVAHIVKKYDIKKESSEDLISIGTIGLIKAVDSFKVEKGHRLTTYASRCIENEILMYLRSSKHHYNNISLNDVITNDQDGSEVSLLDLLAVSDEIDVSSEIVKKNNLKKLKHHLNVLNKRELEIIIRRYGLNGHEEETQRHIANDLKISRSYVSRIEKRAYMKLYREFMKEEKK